MWKINKHIISGVLMAFALLWFLPAMAQPQSAFRAYKLYKQDKLLEAKDVINKSVKDGNGKEDHLTWLFRGFIYKDIYTQLDDKDPDSEARETAINSLWRSQELDTKNEHTEVARKALKYLATSYYNDAVLVMREENMNTIDQAQEYYVRYKENMLKLNPDFNFDPKDVEFYKALATANRKIYEADPENRKEYLNKVFNYYEIVLEIDPDNGGAIYNVAVNLYNEGARPIADMDPEAEIPEVVKVQSISIKNFEAALPYMKKAHKLNPHREEVLKGLRGIYLSINEEEMAEKYRRELQEINRKNKKSGERDSSEQTGGGE